MKKITFLTLLFTFIISVAQSYAQKVAIIGLSHDTTEGFTFLAVEDIPLGEVIRFTDNEYDEPTNVFTYNLIGATGESVFTWVATAAVTKGTVFYVRETTPNTPSISCSSGTCGTITLSPNVAAGNSQNFSFGSVEESLYAYQDNNDDPRDGIGEIYSVFYVHAADTFGPGVPDIPASEDPRTGMDHPNAIVVDGFTFPNADRTEFAFSPASLRDGRAKVDLENPGNYVNGPSSQDLSLAPFTNFSLVTSNPILSVTVSPTSVNENSGTGMIYTFALDTPAAGAITANFNYAGTAGLTSDYTVSGTNVTYTGGSGSIIIPNLATSATITVMPVGEAILEPDETVIITLSTGTGYTTSSPNSATGTILNDDNVNITPLVAIVGSTHSPPISPESFSFVALDDIAAGTLVYFTENDFDNSLLNFPAIATGGVAVWTAPAGGVLRGEVIVATETGANVFTASCDSGTCGTVTTVNGTWDLASQGASIFAYTDSDANPSNGITQIDAVLFTGTSASSGGNIPANEDPSGVYVGSVVVDGFPSLPSERTEYNAALRGVTVDQANFQNITNWLHSQPTGPLSQVPFANIIIAAGSANPSLSVTLAPASTVEDSGTGMIYTFLLDAAATSDITVNFDVSGTATLTTDYTVTGAASFSATAGTAVILNGNTSVDITITPIVDAIVEPTETIELQIASGTGYDGGTPNAATGIITNDDTSDSDPLVAIMGMTHELGSMDSFAFTAAQDIPAGTVIYFTEESFDNTTLLFSSTGEGVVQWTAPAGGQIDQGDVVVITETSSNVFTVTCSDTSGFGCGTAVLISGSFALSSNGESMFAYADSDTDPSNGVDDIYSVMYTGNGITPGGNLPTVEDPSGIYTNALVVDGFAPTAPRKTEYIPGSRNVLVGMADFENPANYDNGIAPGAGLSTTEFANLNIVVTFTAPADICIDVVVQTGLSGGSPIGGVYSGPGVTDDGDGMTYSFDPATAGIGTHTLTYTSGGSPVTDTIEVFALPTVTFTALADLCLNAGVQAGLGGGAPTGGVYSGSGVTDDGNGTTYSFNPAAAAEGTHSITYNFTDTNGCSGSASDTVEVFFLPVVSFTALADLCIDAGVQTSLGGGLATGGVYSGPGVTDDGNGTTYSFDPAAAGVGTHSITYNFTDGNGCSGSANDNVEVFGLPTVTFTALADLCIDAGVQTSLGGGLATGGVYSGPGVTDDGNGTTYSFDPAAAGIGTHSLTYTFTDTNSCTNSTADNVEVFALPTVNFTAPADLCVDAGVQAGLGGGTPMSATSTTTIEFSNVNLSLIISNPLIGSIVFDEVGIMISTDVTFFDPIFNTNSSLINATLGLSNIINLTFDNGFGSIVLNSPQPIVGTTGTISVINSGATLQGLPYNVDLGASVNVSTTAAGAGSGEYSGPGVTDDGNGMTYSFDPAAAGVGTHSLTYTFTDANGCSGSASDNVEVFALPVMTFTAAADVCINAGVQTGLGGAAPSGGVYSGTGVTDDGNGITYSFDPAVAGVGGTLISYDFTDANGCDGYANRMAQVNALPTVTFTALADLCIDAGSQTGLGGGMATGGVYSGPGVTDDGNGMTYSFNPAVAGVGTHMLTYTFTDTNGCTNSASDDVEVFALPVMTFTAAADVCINAGVQTGLGGAAPSGGVYSGTGVIDDGNGITYSFDPAVAGVGGTLISYNFTDANGCDGYANRMAQVNALPTVTFTAPAPDVCIEDTVVTGLGGGLPQGGVYSGLGVTDDGNGMTFSFDPTASAPAGGNVAITYTFTDTNGCTNSTNDSINVNPICCELIVDCSSIVDMVIACRADLPPVDFNLPLITESCGNVTLSALTIIPGNTGCPGDEIIIPRTYFIQDDDGNMTQCTQTFTVRSDNGPTITPISITYSENLDGNCEFIIPDYTSQTTSTVDCGTATITQSPVAGTVITGATSTTITLTATDACGRTAKADITLQTLDVTPPVVVVEDITVPLDENGEASINVEDIYPTFSNLTSNNSWLSFLGVFENSVYITGQPVAIGNVKSTINQADDSIILQPNFDSNFAGNNNAVLQGSTYIEYDSSVGHSFSFSGSVLNNTLDPNYEAFAFIRIFDAGYTLLEEITDNLIAGNTFSLKYNNTQPNAAHIQYGFSVNGPSGFSQSESALGNAVVQGMTYRTIPSDACGIVSTTLDITEFDCDDVGENTVTITVIDTSGNVTTEDATVTIEDNIPPTIEFIENVTVQLDASGNASIDAGTINNGSTDNCGIASLSISKATFDCSDVTTSETNTSLTLNFDGSDDYARIPYNAAYNFGTGPLAVEMLFNKLDDNRGDLFTYKNQHAVDDFTIFVDSDEKIKVWLQIDGAASLVMTSTNPISLGTWNQLAVTRDNSGNWQMYINGQLESTGFNNLDFNNLDPGQDIILGTNQINGNPCCQYFEGSMDEVRIWNVHKSLEDIQSKMSETLKGTETGLISYYPMENGTGSSVFSDLSSIANNGSLSGTMDPSTDWVEGKELTTTSTTSVTLTVRDINGNESYAVSEITVEDNLAPVVICKDLTVQLNENGEYLLAPADLDNGSIDNCGILNIGARINGVMRFSEQSLNCSNIGENSIEVIVVDVNGNLSSCFAIVTVEDSIAPTVVTQDITIQLDTNGIINITAADIDNGSSDNCEIESMSINTTTFDCTEIGEHIVTLTVTDVNGNSASETAIVTVEDTMAPTIVTQNITVQLDANGTANITAENIDNGSTDNCEIETWNIDITNFDCTSMGENTVTLTVTDINGNSASETAIVTIEDNIIPTVSTQNITVQLDADGTATITTDQIDNGSSDNCEIESMSLDITSFDCATIGENTVTLTVTDVNRNSASADAVVTVEDSITPMVLTQNITVQLGTDGTATITADQIDNGSSDNCEIETWSIDTTNFDCTSVGENTVTLTVTDVNGNSASATATVTVEDSMAPTVVAQNMTVQLDANGTAIIKAVDIDNSSTDNCEIETWSLDTTNFDCSNVGENTVTLTVTDVNGNSASASAIVTVEDSITPTVVAQDITLQIDANGTASITAEEIDNGSSDNCEIELMSLDITSFDCATIGENTVTLTVTDVNGNSANATAIVTIEDKMLPTVSTQNITVQLGANGTATITADQIDNGSSDNCEIESMSLDVTSFDCTTIGENTVTLTVTDVNGNSEIATAIVTVEDKMLPTVSTQNITVQLGADGTATITADQINNGSSDNCEIESMSLDITSFNCAYVGENTVTLTVTDINGNSEIATAIVTVEDNLAPTVIVQNITVELDANGNASITSDQINNGSSDNCGIESISIDVTSFNCAEVGDTNVTLTVTDVNGNSADATAVVTVKESFAPLAICAAPFTIQLDETGSASISVEDINNGSSDNCGIESMSIDVTSFDCTSIGENTITLTVTDTSGNTSMCTTIVTVEDMVVPIVVTQNISVELDSNGNANISAEDIDDGSFDACGIASLSLDQTSFSCPNLGDITVTLTVVDTNGNTASEMAVVTFTSDDLDNDGIADSCDLDLDGDNINNDIDNCPTVANPNQTDLDRNGIGDICDSGELEIPKGFSPNGDGTNDEFIISGLHKYPNNSIQIYNRYGNMVYESNNYQNYWDGISSGKNRKLPAAPYFYVLSVNGGSKIVKGWLYINY